MKDKTTTQIDCSECGGDGYTSKYIDDDGTTGHFICDACGGKGRISKNLTLKKK